MALLSTQKARTQDSAKAFMEGLCGGTHTYTDQTGTAGITEHDRLVVINSHGFCGNYTIQAKPLEEDPVLRFFDMCPAYDDYVTQIDTDFLVSNTSASSPCMTEEGVCQSEVMGIDASAYCATHPGVGNKCCFCLCREVVCCCHLSESLRPVCRSVSAKGPARVSPVSLHEPIVVLAIHPDAKVGTKVPKLPYLNQNFIPLHTPHNP